MQLSEFVTNIYVPSRIELAEQYEKKIHSVVGKFSEFLERDARMKDFCAKTVCDYLANYRRKGWSARATNNQRQILLSLWQDAANRDMADEPSRKRIRKLPEEVDPPEAWSESQIAQLMKEAAKQRGRIASVPSCDWWLSLFLTIYWTSNRISAMLAVESKHYDGEGVLVRKQKNKRPQWFPLPESCREVIERTQPENRSLIWEHPWHPRTVWTKARDIIEDAGLPCPRTGRQLFHRLRRSTVTLCASVDPDVAQRTAGHRDYQTTLKSYIDPRLLRAKSAMDVLPDPLSNTQEIPRLRIFG